MDLSEANWLKPCLFDVRLRFRTRESQSILSMSTESTGTISQQIQELENLRRQTRRFNIWATLALAAIVIVGVGAIIGSFYSLTVSGPKQAEFLQRLGGDLQQQLPPAVQKFAQPSVKRLKPALEAELRRLDARAPQVVDVALRELNTMGTNLPVRAGIILQQTVGTALHQRDARLRQMLPGTSDAQVITLLDSIHLDAQDQLLKVGEKMFNPHLNSIHSILANLDKIEKTEPVAGKQEINTWQVAFLFLDVFGREFNDLALTDTTKPQEPK